MRMGFWEGSRADFWEEEAFWEGVLGETWQQVVKALLLKNSRLSRENTVENELPTKQTQPSNSA